MTDRAVYTNFVNKAYNIHSQKPITPPGGWEVLTRSDKSDLANKYSFKCVAFINEQEKKIILAHAGTTDGYDVIDDAMIVAHKVPYKIESIKSFIDEVENLVSDSKEYIYETTGHSLGGILSDLSAVELKARGLNITQSVTFDNPGSYPVIKTAIDQKVFTGQIESIRQLEQDINFHAFNSCPHFINTINKPLGTVSLVVPPKGADYKVGEKHESQGFTAYVLAKIGSAVLKGVSDILGISTQVLEFVETLEFSSNILLYL